MEIAQIRGTILFLAAFLCLVLALVYWIKGKTKITFHLGWLAFFSATYAFFAGGLYFFEGNKLFWMRANWSAVLIGPAVLSFVYYFTGRTRYIRLKTFFWYLGGLIIVYLALTTPYFTKDVASEYPYVLTPGPLDLVGRLFILVCLLIGAISLFKDYFRNKGFKKLQIKYFIIGASIWGGGGIIVAAIIPIFYPGFTYGDIAAVLSAVAVVLSTYAIYKGRLFGVRVILTEILVSIIALILLIQFLISGTFQAKMLGAITLIAFVFVGYLLIRVTRNEIRRKEEAGGLAKELKELNETLEQRVKKRTRELETSYQEIKNRKDELEEFYKLIVGRELKMIGLKKEIKILQKRVEKKILKEAKS